MENIIVLASNNQHKIKEYKQMFKNCKILTMDEVGYTQDIVEDGETFLENSLIKANTIHKYLQDKGIKAVVIADDSGLCVNALNGEPGVYSARYAGEHGDSSANRKLLLKKLEGTADRSGCFYCCIVGMSPNGKYIVGEGKTFGDITKEEIGNKSFGYDCVFYSYDLKKTFGESTNEDKNKVSHRGRAFQDLICKNKEIEMF